MNELKELLKLDYIALIMGVFILMAGIIAVYTIIGKFSEIIKKPVSWVKKKNDDHDMLLRHDKEIKELAKIHKSDTDKITDEESEIKKNIAKLTNMFLDKQISDYRWEIINLADEILNGKTVSKECLKHAISIHSKYETIIEENGFTNGEVELSMKIINKSYLDLMEAED